MTPAEFDTRRRALGLSVGECAALIGVAERTVNRWANGVSPIPDDVAEALGNLENAMIDAVDNAVTLATDRVADGPVVLWRYRTPDEQTRSPHAASLPMGAHAMLIAWTADALAAEGVDVSIEWAS